MAELHPIEYGRRILETSLGWPAAQSNLELMADCLRAISQSKSLNVVQSHAYLARAIRLATEQGVVIDRFFFLDGRYTEIRPKAMNTSSTSSGNECERCGGLGRVHQLCTVPGKRLVPCPACAERPPPLDSNSRVFCLRPYGWVWPLEFNGGLLRGTALPIDKTTVRSCEVTAPREAEGSEVRGNPGNV